MNTRPPLPPAPWRRSPSGTMVIAGSTEIRQRCVGDLDRAADPLALACAIAALPALLDALEGLCRADAANYEAHAMRYEGYFERARAALRLAGREVRA